ncbi:hypothetical protein L9F63_027480, partial [Diploptera punctata]
MYMRLLGYPADKISILTTYNGQKHLIRDVINIRCATNPLIGRPHKITTVDKYQGQQNDYILLSLVRTKAVGHLRDVRRLVVAMSRARLGLYIFARVSLFKNCFELTPAFSQLMARPLKLHIIPQEAFPTQRQNNSQSSGMPQEVEDMPQMAAFVYEYYIQKVQAMKTALCTRKQSDSDLTLSDSSAQMPNSLTFKMTVVGLFARKPSADDVIKIDASCSNLKQLTKRVTVLQEELDEIQVK